jgi:hypothetical protein
MRSDLKEGFNTKNHPPAPASKIIRGILKKIVIGGASRVMNQRESTRTHDVIAAEARAGRAMLLTDLRMSAEARREKIAVTAR